MTTVKLHDFAAALAFVNAVGAAAEAANHHPDIDIRWNTVRLVLTTHDSGGITLLDLALAGVVDRLRPDIRADDDADDGEATVRPRGSSSAARRLSTSPGAGAEPLDVGADRPVLLLQVVEQLLHLRRVGREDLVDVLERLAALGVLRDELGPQPQHGRAAQRVVGHHRRLVHAQQREHDGREDAGAVLAGGAVEHGRAARRARPAPRGRPGSGSPASRTISRYCVPSRPGPAVEVLGIGQLVDEGEVVERHRVGLDVEAAPLQLGAGAQVDDRPDAELAQHGEVGLGQLAQAVGPEERAPARPRAVAGLVAAQVAEVDRALQRDHPVKGLCHVSAPPRSCSSSACSLHARAVAPDTSANSR